MLLSPVLPAKLGIYGWKCRIYELCTLNSVPVFYFYSLLCYFTSKCLVWGGIFFTVVAVGGGPAGLEVPGSRVTPGSLLPVLLLGVCVCCVQNIHPRRCWIQLAACLPTAVWPGSVWMTPLLPNEATHTNSVWVAFSPHCGAQLVHPEKQENSPGQSEGRKEGKMAGDWSAAQTGINWMLPQSFRS